MSHPLVAQLRSGDAGARRAACAAIAEDPAAALLVQPLCDALGDADPGVRRAASAALARVGRSSPEVDRALLASLRSDEPSRRFAAARALADLAPPSPRLVPVLIEALGDAQRETAWEAARILVDAGRLHEEVVPIVIGLVRAGPSPAARAMALACLRELAPEHPEAIPAALEASRDPDPALRRAAFTALPALDGGAPEIRARIEEAMDTDPDPGVRHLAGRARELLGEEKRS